MQHKHIKNASIALILSLFSIFAFADKIADKTTLTIGTNQHIRPQDDFYKYVNNDWLKTATIPDDKTRWGSFDKLSEDSELRLKEIITTLNTNQANQNNPDAKQILALYNSYMNEKHINQLGNTPILPILNKIDKITSKDQFGSLFAYFTMNGIGAPQDMAIHSDAYNSSIMVVDLMQSGLGLPDRDYYLNTKDKTLIKIKNEYRKYISKMLALSNIQNPDKKATDIINLETQIAQIQWTNVENRDPVKTYNKIDTKDLTALMPNYNWDDYLSQSHIKDKITYVTISQPSYFKNLDILIKNTPLDTWKAYFKWQVINSYAGYLSCDYVKNSFNFYGVILSGAKKDKPRAKKGVLLVEGDLGFLLGKLYVAKYFPETNKQKMKLLVGNLIEEYEISIKQLDWMTDDTKKSALKKLSHLTLKIGYPDKWRDYSDLKLNDNNLLSNIIQINNFEYNYAINKLGKPIDKTEWGMTPQTVNAYYNPEFNEIVFPAGILQPPFFDANRDDALNYGGIGAVIGHEISHAFDDQGSQYDENGNLHNWWTPADKAKFKQKTSQLVKQYNAYSPLKGYYINGELTLGENIADNSGLSIAYKTYHLSLNGANPPIINGLTGDERFYTNWATVWRGKVRDKQLIMYLKTNPHSPNEFRANGALSNQDEFYQTYNIKIGDKMYIAPDERVHIW